AMSGREPTLDEAKRIKLRIGINLGDIIVEGADIYGDGVNIAARLETLAPPQGICISGSAFDAIDGKIDASFEDMGPQRVKNIAKPLRAYRLGKTADKETPPAATHDALELPSKASIAVLPFATLSGEAAQDHFADGIAEEVVTTLSKVSRLFVIARNATLVYKDRSVDIRQIGRDLGVRYVLEGSVRSGGQRLRVAAQLIEAASGQQLWAQRYDRDLGDVFDLQDDIAKEIVSALQVELTAGDQARLAAQGTQNAEAWQLAFEGRDLVHEHHKDSVRNGRRLLEQAVGLDESYALAWGALAEARWKEARNEGWSPSPERSLALAIDASDRALALDPDNASLLAMRSVITVTQRHFDDALDMAERALRLAFSDANAMALAAITLYACGKADAALKQTELAMRHCPIYPPWYLLMLARCRWMLGQNEAAVAAAKATVKADPNLALGYAELAIVTAESGCLPEAREAVEKLLAIEPHYTVDAFIRGLPLQDRDMEERRQAALRAAGLPD
ncbi:MAG TPA: adenylate/guanylate cyclase domain-containing protein, partial [Kiloniellaceae bacterium]|nr:adenylate/guanylate cyclase domain-containing protein [Kiloniellaceae bacterium]